MLGLSVLITTGRLWSRKKNLDFLDGLPLDWAVDDDFGEEALAIKDAIEEDFMRDKMIARQKSKGKREDTTRLKQ